MDFGLGLLTFGTLGFAIAFAYANIRAIERRREQDSPKSTLAADAPNSRKAVPAR